MGTAGDSTGTGTDPRRALAVGAHPDDVELIALPEIAAARSGSCRLAAVVCCDGAGSPSPDGLSPERLAGVRAEEARAAAAIGNYELTLLGHPSAFVREEGFRTLVSDLRRRLEEVEAARVVTHAPTDRHPTHVAVAAATVAAARSLEPGRRPDQVLGCEVWGGLDWLRPEAVARDVTGLESLSRELLAAHGSQLAVEPYDVAAAGRALANAVFADPDAASGPAAVTLAIDLSPCIRDDGPTLQSLAVAAVARHAAQVGQRLSPYVE